MDGVNSARLTIPICHFHEGNCAKGLEALRSYKAEWSEELRTFKKSPAHDWASHASDSFRYLSLAWRQPVAAEEVVTTKQIVAAMCKPKTWNEIWAMRAEDCANAMMWSFPNTLTISTSTTNHWKWND